MGPPAEPPPLPAHTHIPPGIPSLVHAIQNASCHNPWTWGVVGVWMDCAGTAWLQSFLLWRGDVGRRRGGCRRRLAKVPLSRHLPPVPPQVHPSFTSMHALWEFRGLLRCFLFCQFLTPVRCWAGRRGVSSRAAAVGHRAAGTFLAHARSLHLWGATAIDLTVCGCQRAAFSVRRPGGRRPSGWAPAVVPWPRVSALHSLQASCQ